MAMQRVFERLRDLDGFEPYHDTYTGALVGVGDRRDGGRLDVGTDYGFCTLEVALPPETGFEHARSAWNRCLDELVLPALASEGLTALGYGCQPRTETVGRAYVAAKGHYKLWADLVERCPVAYAADAWPGFAAIQFNVDVAVADLVPVADTLVKLAPLIVAMSANDAVFGGRVQPWQSLRVEGHLALAGGNPFFGGRLYLPHHLSGSLAGYMMQAWACPLFEIVRDGRVFHPAPTGLTTLEFAARGRAEFVDLAGYPATLECTTTDLATGLVFFWPAVRIKTRIDEDLEVADVLAAVSAGRAESVLRDAGRGSFVEIRHLPTMGRVESFAWLALMLGILDHVEAAAAVVDGWSLDEVSACTRSVLLQGWAATVDGRPLRDVGGAVLDLAGAALSRSGAAPVGALAPLARRVEDATSPGADALRLLRDEGMDGLVDHLRLG